MEFKGRRTGKYEVLGRFVERMQKIQEEARAVLEKAQEEMKRYADGKRSKGEEYRVGNLVLLSTKDLKWQIKGRILEKLTKHFVGPYKVRRIISVNVVELDLSVTVKIHLVVNVSRLQLYRLQVEGQKAMPPAPVIVEREEEDKMEKILNKRKVQEKDKFLVRWKGYIAEADTWEERENLGNAKELVEEFKKEYGEDDKEIRQQKQVKEEKEFDRGLPNKYMAKLTLG